MRVGLRNNVPPAPTLATVNFLEVSSPSSMLSLPTVGAVSARLWPRGRSLPLLPSFALRSLSETGEIWGGGSWCLIRLAWIEAGGFAGIAAAMLSLRSFSLAFTRSFSFWRCFRVDALRSRMSHRIGMACASHAAFTARLCQLRQRSLAWAVTIRGQPS